MFGFQHLRAQTRPRRDLDFGEVKLLGVACLLFHLVVALETCLVLGLTGLRRAANPVELVLQALGELGVLGALDFHTLGFRLQIRGVVALVRVQVAAVDFANPFGHVVHEVAVVGDSDDGALVLVQELFEPQNRFGVQMVGGFVEQQQVGGFKQQTAQGDTTALATGAHADRGVGVGALQRVHRLLKLGVEIPAVGGVDFGLQLAHFLHEGVVIGVGIRHFLADLVEALNLLGNRTERHLDVLADGLVFVERRILLEDADRVARGEGRFAV